MSVEAVEEVKNEEVAEIDNNEVIEEANEEAQVKATEAATKQEEVKTEAKEEAKPKPKATPKKLARTVKVVELVSCEACSKKMTPKSLKHTHPHYCKGQPTETLPVNKQKASYGSKVEQKLRKEIEEEMKKKYLNKENDKNAQNVKNEVVQYSEHEVSCSSATLHEPIEVKTKAKPVDDVLTSSSAGNARASPPSVPSVPKQLTARELLEASYNEIRKAKKEAHIEKINSFKSKMF